MMVEVYSRWKPSLLGDSETENLQIQEEIMILFQFEYRSFTSLSTILEQQLCGKKE
jgi:hypothetical protein